MPCKISRMFKLKKEKKNPVLHEMRYAWQGYGQINCYHTNEGDPPIYIL